MFHILFIVFHYECFINFIQFCFIGSSMLFNFTFVFCILHSTITLAIVVCLHHSLVVSYPPICDLVGWMSQHHLWPRGWPVSLSGWAFCVDFLAYCVENAAIGKSILNSWLNYISNISFYCYYIALQIIFKIPHNRCQNPYKRSQSGLYIDQIIAICCEALPEVCAFVSPGCQHLSSRLPVGLAYGSFSIESTGSRKWSAFVPAEVCAEAHAMWLLW